MRKEYIKNIMSALYQDGWDKFHELSLPHIQKDEEQFLKDLLSDPYGMFSIDTRGLTNIKIIEEIEREMIKKYTKNLSFISTFKIVNQYLWDLRGQNQESFNHLMDILTKAYLGKERFPNFNHMSQQLSQELEIKEKSGFLKIKWKDSDKKPSENAKIFKKEIKNYHEGLSNESLYFFNFALNKKINIENFFNDNKIDYKLMKTAYIMVPYYHEQSSQGTWGISQKDKKQVYEYKDIVVCVYPYDEVLFRDISQEDAMKTYDKMLKSNVFTDDFFARFPQEKENFSNFLQQQILCIQNRDILNTLNLTEEKKKAPKL